MRSRFAIPAVLVALTLLGVPLAIAAGGSPNAHASKGQAKAADHRDNATHNATGHNDTGDRGKPAAASAWHARLKTLLASWHENATKIREDCKAAEKPAHANNTTDHNASKAARLAWAQCVRDGYREFREAWRAEWRAARDDSV